MKKIIYVFGPRRLAETYFANRPMMLNEGGWLKIGQTTNSDEKTGVKDSALNRIRQETRTGIPEVCQIFDVFEYPDRTGNTDNTIREILTEDVYKLECSKKHNSEIEKYEIKAGTEFVYGVTRKQVLNSIAKFEHGLILEHYGRDDFAELMQCIKNNAKNAEQYEIESDESSHDNYESTHWADMLWDSVKKELEVQIKSKICTNKGRPYISIASNKHKGTITYTAVYSVRYGLASVAIETFGGESAKETIDKKIQSSTEKHSLKTITAKQGIKNKNKWSWAISVPIDKSDDELIKWYVDTILSFYRFFEN
jgi:hypothetical protein